MDTDLGSGIRRAEIIVDGTYFTRPRVGCIGQASVSVQLWRRQGEPSHLYQTILKVGVDGRRVIDGEMLGFGVEQGHQALSRTSFWGV